MFKCSSKKIGFIHVPKTGGTSIKKALMPIADKGQIDAFDGDRVINAHRWVAHRALGRRQRKDLRDFQLFAVVRNPWARYVSMFKRKKATSHHLYLGVEFDQWVSTGRWPPIHRNDQSFYLGGDHGILVDTVLRHETLCEDFRAFSEEHDLGVELPERRFKGGGVYDYREYYTPETLQAIEPLVRRDAERFGYAFD